ncbi:MAG: hypothetical protein JWN26_821 [Candidatus Saccharibacteria bacterium]|nr:hypothetical protein [Candidatus Saccharibacteria bacterium]
MRFKQTHTMTQQTTPILLTEASKWPLASAVTLDTHYKINKKK